MKKFVLLGIAVLLMQYSYGQDTIPEGSIARPYRAKHPQDPDLPQFFIRSANTKLELGIGGFVRLTGSFDFNGVISSYDFITYDIPVGNTVPVEKRLYLDAHQSRLFAEVLGKVNGKSIRIYIETDFYSDQYYPRLRHAYGQIGSFLMGQTWSSLMDLDAMPNTIDFEGPNSAIALRQPMIRYSGKFGKQFRLTAAMEFPDVSMSYRSPYERDQQFVPDLILALKFGNKNNHIQCGGVLRSMTFRDTLAEKTEMLHGYGASLSGKISVFHSGSMMFQASGGTGIAKYIQDISGQGLDGVSESSNDVATMATIPVWGFYIAYEQHWSKHFYSTFTYGLTNIPDTYSLPSGDEYELGQYASANIFWNMNTYTTIALEYLWGQRRNYGNEQGKANRINAMAQFTF